MTIKLKEDQKRRVTKFPLELKVFYDSRSGDLMQVFDGNWLSPEDNLPGDLEVFKGAPDNVKFGAHYIKIREEKHLGITRVVYQHIKEKDSPYR